MASSATAFVRSMARRTELFWRRVGFKGASRRTVGGVSWFERGGLGREGLTACVIPAFVCEGLGVPVCVVSDWVQMWYVLPRPSRRGQLGRGETHTVSSWSSPRPW